MSETVGGIIYTVDLDTAALTKGADRINATLAQVGKVTDKLDGHADRASASLNRTGDALAAVGSRSGTAASGLNRITQAVRGVFSGSDSAREKVKSLLDTFKGADDSAKSFGDTAESISKTKGNIEDTQNPLKEFIDKLREGGDSAVETAGKFKQLIAVAAALALLKEVVDVQREFDKLNAGLVTATGSAEKAAEAFTALQQFATETPYGLAQAVEGFTQLVNLGLTPSEEAMRSFGNTASAMGKDLNQMIGAVADATTGEFERLKEFGIRASKEGGNVTFTFQGVKKTVKDNAADIEKYLISLGKVEFVGAMQKRMDTLDGAIANLADTWDATLLSLSQQGIGAAVRSSVEEASAALGELNNQLASGQLAAEFGSVAAKFSGYGKDFQTTFDTITQYFKDSSAQWPPILLNNVNNMIDTFAHLPENVRAFVGIMAVEVAAGFDRVGKYATAFKNGLAAIFNDTTFEGVGKELEAGLKGVDQARQDSIAGILAERDASVKSQTDQAEAAKKLREQYDATAAARKKSTEDRLAKFKKPGDTDSSDPGAAKIIKDLEDQQELLKVIGVERAKLSAIQKLGDNASPAQRVEAEKLAASIYKLQEAEKERNSASKKGASEVEAEQKKNLKTITDLENALALLNVSARDASIQKAADALGKLATPEQVARAKELAAAAFDATQAKAAATAIKNLNEQILQAGTSARELAQRQAEVALGEYATPDQIAQVRQLAGALYDVQQRQTLLSSLKTDVPMVGEQANYEEQLARYQQYRDQQLITDQTYLDLRQQAEAAHEANLTKLQEERFRQQSKGNELLMASLDQVQTAGTNAFVGLVTGATTGQEAVQALASSIINEAVGAVVAYGVAQLKSLIIGQSAGAAATASSVAEAATVTAAWAPAAAATSVATLGAAPAIGLSSLAAAVPAALALFGGGRQYGGAVDMNKMYRVNEGGAPEIFNAAGGKQYMMPNTRGEVVSNKDASGATGGGTGNAPIVNVNNYTGQQTTASARYSEADKRFIIDVVAGDIGKGGKTGKVVNRTTGTRRAGS